MVKALFASLIGVAAAGVADIDCSKATCEEACTCSLDKCASQIDECLAAPNCASGQACALGCACGDTACTLKCAASSPSIKALPVAKCINSECNVAALKSKADIDCSKATCEEACTCSLDKCASQIDECLAAPNCASGQACALGCACGDTACTLKCAASSPSIKALPVAKCINSECNVALKSKADIDCSKATCEEACTCSLDKCASQIDECLAAPNCASGQACALGCACGDTACTLKCAASSPSIKALPVAKCINSECNVALKSKADVDCSKATCQADCECSLQQCASEIDACLAAPNCAASQDCALACPCSDNACMLKCAASSPSIKALPVAKCVNSKCGSASVSV